MAVSNVQTKIALFLKPARIDQRWSPLQVFHIIKSNRGIEYAQEPMTEESVDKHFRQQPKEWRELLIRLGDPALALLVQEITRTHAKQKAGTSLHAYIERSFVRQLQQLLQQALPLARELPIYHRSVNPKTGNHLTEPCVLSPNQPKLSFKVGRNEEGSLGLETFVQLDGETTPLEAFILHTLFLQRGKEYYLLSYLDHQTLRWLEANNPDDYAKDPVAFSEHVVSKLQTDYPVEVSGLLNKQEVKVPPVNAVYLSEISGNFLMLTPRYNYDGFWVEGPWQMIQEFNRNGETYVVYRDKEAEQGFHDFLQGLHPTFGRQLNGYFYLPFSEAKKKHWFLKVYHQLLADNVELIGMEMLQQFRYSPYPVQTELRISKTVDSIMHLHMKVGFGKEEVQLNELQKLLLAGQRSLLLKDHSIAILDDKWMAQYSAILKHGKISKNEVVIPQWILLGIDLEENEASTRPAISQEWWNRWTKWQEEDHTVISLPATIKATLRPYQQKGFEWMCLLAEIDAGACLADDMGLGKTLQTICFLAYLNEREANGKYMIVCPASLIHNWRKELEKFAPHLKASVYHSTQRNMEQFFKEDAQVLITSYGTMRSDIEQLQLVQWAAVVLDESHTIKNPSAQITRAVYQLKAKARVALSGTPVMNNTFDLYAQLQFLVPGLFGGQEFFRKVYAHPIDREHDEEKIRALQKMTAPFILRRTKKQVATDLPPKTESVLWCEMGVEQKALYEEVKGQIRDSLFLNIKNDGLGKSKLSILQGMQKLRQICAAPQLLGEAGYQQSPAVKIEVLLDELQHNLRNNKVLVFSQFKGMLQMIGDACKRSGIKFYHFDGDTPPAKRSEMVAQFQEEGNEVMVFLISLKAGNTGLTLTAADYVFLVDPWWNTAVQQQAIDRAYRIGQTKNVFAYQMICKDSIEEKIIELQQRKRMLSDALVTEDDSFVKELSEEDLRYLFE
ncbi:DEAD/DEAH box helicase [Flavihumibacter rivuli]|uniref:DEAD/DEAH box helicase n=1 Tax=Flavihumibacter rivuli TaxID=2838156 RepID=UPI001BDEA426|nr:DEAD/DEAH box helicase [Flavihumibacter rivuli]ULQ55784.1 DEAD/DEAH box helicase [Flavihumibacter rivuli]